MSQTVKIAGVQMDIQLGQIEQNLARVFDFLKETTARGATLTVFPECTISGYCFESFAEALSVAEPIDGPIVIRLQEFCEQLSTTAICGWLERDDQQLFNSLVLVGPSGVLGSYRKIHLPYLGVDRFTTPGDRPFAVVQLPQLTLGMNICYDSSFPEAARVLALKGADLVALPTNWPPTSGLTADVIPNARALENHVYFMAINRIGSEGGFEFIGKSKICDPRGANLAFANHNREEILVADIDPLVARQKHLVNIPGAHEVHRFKDRRPEAYELLSKSTESFSRPD